MTNTENRDPRLNPLPLEVLVAGLIAGQWNEKLTNERNIDHWLASGGALVAARDVVAALAQAGLLVKAVDALPPI